MRRKFPKGLQTGHRHQAIHRLPLRYLHTRGIYRAAIPFSPPSLPLGPNRADLFCHDPCRTNTSYKMANDTYLSLPSKGFFSLPEPAECSPHSNGPLRVLGLFLILLPPFFFDMAGRQRFEDPPLCLSPKAPEQSTPLLVFHGIFADPHRDGWTLSRTLSPLKAGHVARGLIPFPICRIVALWCAPATA